MFLTVCSGRGKNTQSGGRTDAGESGRITTQSCRCRIDHAPEAGCAEQLCFTSTRGFIGQLVARQQWTDLEEVLVVVDPAELAGWLVTEYGAYRSHLTAAATRPSSTTVSGGIRMWNTSAMTWVQPWMKYRQPSSTTRSLSCCCL